MLFFKYQTNTENRHKINWNGLCTCLIVSNIVFVLFLAHHTKTSPIRHRTGNWQSLLPESVKNETMLSRYLTKRVFGPSRDLCRCGLCYVIEMGVLNVANTRHRSLPCRVWPTCQHKINTTVDKFVGSDLLEITLHIFHFFLIIFFKGVNQLQTDKINAYVYLHWLMFSRLFIPD